MAERNNTLVYGFRLFGFGWDWLAASSSAVAASWRGGLTSAFASTVARPTRTSRLVDAVRPAHPLLGSPVPLPRLVWFG